MTNREKAQKGLAMLKESVYDTIRQNRGIIGPTQIARELGIESSDKKGTHKNWFANHIGHLLAGEGKVKHIKRRGFSSE